MIESTRLTVFCGHIIVCRLKAAVWALDGIHVSMEGRLFVSAGIIHDKSPC